MRRSDVGRRSNPPTRTGGRQDPGGTGRSRANRWIELLGFIHKDISSKGDFSTPTLCIFVSAFERGHEILRRTQTLSQISGVFDRKKVEVRFIVRMETGNCLNFLIEVVVSHLSRASLVDRCQLDQINWGS